MGEKRKRGKPAPASQPARRFGFEEDWIHDFIGFYATENIMGCSLNDLDGVNLTRALEAVAGGIVIASEKSDGPGTECLMHHRSDDGTVEVLIHFEAHTMRLEIREARYIEEHDSEPYAA